MKARPRTTAAKKRLQRMKTEKRLKKKTPNYHIAGRHDIKGC